MAKIPTQEVRGTPQFGFLRASVISTSAATCGLLAVFVTSAMGPQLQSELSLTPSRIGLVFAAFFGISAISAPLGGRLADGFGEVRVMRCSLLLSAFCLLAVGILAHGWLEMVVAIGCAGAANGILQPAVNRYISRETPGNRQGLAFGVKQAALPAAMLLGSIAVPAAIHLADWRALYVAAAVLAAGVAGIVVSPTNPRTKLSTSDYTAFPALDRRGLISLAIGWALGSAGGNALGAFFIIGSVHAGFTPGIAALLAAVGALASVIVRVLTGFAADYWSGSGLGVVALMSGIGALSVLLLATGIHGAFLLAIPMAFGIGWGWSALVNYSVVRTYPRQPGQSTGITQAGASIGACVGPLAFGVLVSTFGYNISWIVAGAVLLAVVPSVLIGRSLLHA